MCLDVLRAGKHLICEKPFGIDAEANRAIVEEARKHPELLVRCASQMIFLPGARMVLEWFRERRFGRILQIKMGFKHSSDINPLKPINWKRRVETNGEYGVMGDLAPHILLMALRAGVEVEQVYAEFAQYRAYQTRPRRTDGSLRYMGQRAFADPGALGRGRVSHGSGGFPHRAGFAQ